MDQGQKPKSKYRIEVVASVIGAAFGMGSFAIAALSYIHPTDATHPVHFDFFYQTVSFPLWAAGTLALALIAVTAGFVRWTIKRPLKQPDFPLVTPEPLPTPHELQTPVPKPTVVSTDTSIASVFELNGVNELIIPSPDDLMLNIHVDEQQETKSCILVVDNDRLGAISSASLTIYSAYSYNGNRGEFRTVPTVSGIRMDNLDVVLPSFSAKPFLLVRKDPNNDYLFAGNNTSNKLIWPDNDKARIQKWKLSASFFAQTWPQNSTAMPKPLTVVKFEIIVTWDMDSNELSVQRG